MLSSVRKFKWLACVRVSLNTYGWFCLHLWGRGTVFTISSIAYYSYENWVKSALFLTKPNWFLYSFYWSIYAYILVKKYSICSIDFWISTNIFCILIIFNRLLRIGFFFLMLHFIHNTNYINIFRICMTNIQEELI